MGTIVLQPLGTAAVTVGAENRNCRVWLVSLTANAPSAPDVSDVSVLLSEVVPPPAVGVAEQLSVEPVAENSIRYDVLAWIVIPVDPSTVSGARRPSLDDQLA